MKNKKIASLIPQFPFAPVFLATSCVISLFLRNIGSLTIDKLFLPLFEIILFSTFFAIVCRFVFRNRTKGYTFASVCMILFFSYGQILYPLRGFHLVYGTVNIGINEILFPVWLLLFFLSFYFIFRTKRSLSSLRRFFGITGLLTILIPTVGILFYQVQRQIHPPATSQLKLPILSTTDLKTLPDVYYIVPDSYAGPPAFLKYFSYDDSNFTNYLEKKGFYVATNSTSNYPTTLLSLSSTLNMEYVDYLSKFPNTDDESIAQPLIENSNVLELFRSLGYKYYQMGSWWWPTATNRNADENYNVQKHNRLNLDGFTYTLLESTMAGPILDSLLPEKVMGESNEDKRTIIVYQFDTFPKITKLPGPKFVFAHIIAPHDPYVFDKNCEFISHNVTDTRREEENYGNQVSCINKKLQETIDEILKTSSHPPIILLQADEGAKFIAERLNPAENWKDAKSEQLKMKFPILSAYYLPGVSTEPLYKEMTPVNSFRIIFNLYFSANLPLLPDKNYIYLDAKHLYDFVEVTDTLKNKTN